MSNEKKVQWILRIAVAGEFIGHGVFALQKKEGWIHYFTSVGFSEPTALFLLPLIGLADLLVALVILFKPWRPVVIWAVFWAFSTALIRPIAGEPIWDFVERFANIGAPLALFYLMWPAGKKK